MSMVGFITGAAASSALTYLFDPEAGRRRRALLRDQVTHLEHKVRDDVQATARVAANPARGFAAQAREKLPFSDRLSGASSAGPASRGTSEMAIAGAALALLMVPFARRLTGRLLLGSLPQLLAVGGLMAARRIQRQEEAARERGRQQLAQRQEGDGAYDDQAPPVTMIDPAL
jgi:hypothetical protein